jgi:DNA-binding transcriptional regulator YbjK
MNDEARMTNPQATDSALESALLTCAAVLRRLAAFELHPDLQHRIEQLSQQKEFLDEGQHAELLALAEFWRKRLIEKLEARAALERLKEFIALE